MSLDYATLRVRKRVNNHKSFPINFVCDILHAANFQPCHHAKQNVLFGIAQSTAALIYGYSAPQIANDPLSDRLASIGNDDDGCIFLDTVNQKVNRL